MYFTAAQIARSIGALSRVHPFHGITFLACKQAKLPVGREIVFPLDSETDKFLRQHHQIDPGSDWFFQPFKSSATTKKWVRPDYSAKGLQAINTQTFLSAFLHKPGSRIWGWSPNYIRVLAAKLPRKQKIPTFHLAVWLFRDSEWNEAADGNQVVERFLEGFLINAEERSALFDLTSPRLNQTFQESKPSWEELRPLLPAAPDSKPEQGGTLAYMETRGLGPADTFIFEPASRLNLITGDNGLGKSFLLEVAWWALTDVWAGRPSYPDETRKNAKVEITFAIKGELSQPQRRTIAFDWKTSSWPPIRKRPTIPGLIVYARVDGSFAVWDPARQNLSPAGNGRANKATFSTKDVWDGSEGRIEGLIRDWVHWQNEPGGARFDTFRSVLARLSPPDLGQLKPGTPVRIFDELREIPTVVHPYGETPILYASAGVRRIVALAYLIVWAWHEHFVASKRAKVPTQRRMVVLVDEIEAHLHPRWQRSLLPALLEVNELLSPALKAQFLVATHSPLVMASAETVFDPETDKQFHLDMDPTGEVTLKEIEFVRFGDVSSWLTSPLFELRHARSSEGEAVIEDAKQLQLNEKTTKEQVLEITERLKRFLAPEDRFWPRWMAYAERFGVEI
jgi:AAA domain, putative AbiEii toxin, Type IV TA system